MTVESGKLAVKDKLVALLTDGNNPAWKWFPNNAAISAFADFLIANGATFVEESAAFGKWIPVTERLPELLPCSAGTGYSEAVNVLTSGRKVMVAIWDGADWLCDMEYWDAWGEEITHWTPVLLPLPEPPKGE